jgi:Cu(I)/Ag(I) efflux system membrane fusion protein
MAGDHEALWLPVSAVVNLGKQQTVFAMQGAKFSPAIIHTGLRLGDYIEILSGIDEDSKIALNALLLTDSDGFIHANSQ